MTEDEIRARNEERRAKLDAVSRRNMEKCAAFIAKMIRKYGPEVLSETWKVDELWRIKADDLGYFTVKN